MFMNDENKRRGQAIEIARETTNNQEKKYNSVKHLQRQQFSFTKTSIKLSVSQNPESLSLKLKLKFTLFYLQPASRCLPFLKMNSSKQENRSKFSFYSQIHN